MTARRKLTTLDKLKIVADQARCPLCGEKLGELADLDFDHRHALALGGTDTLDNLRAVHRDCHASKTRGNGATTNGSDIGEMRKTRQLVEDRIERGEVEPDDPSIAPWAPNPDKHRPPKQVIRGRGFPPPKDKRKPATDPLDKTPLPRRSLFGGAS